MKLDRKYPPHYWGKLTWFLIYTVVGVAVAKIQPEQGASLWYPPIAIGLLFLLLHGIKFWPIIFVADFLVAYLQYQHSVLTALVVSGSTIGELVLAYLLLKKVEFGQPPSQVKDLIRFAVVVPVATGVGATIGCTLFKLTGLINENIFELWGHWWLGDLTTLLCLFLPISLLVSSDIKEFYKKVLHPDQSFRGRLFLIAVTLAMVCALSIGFQMWTKAGSMSLRPLLFMPILWAAFRFDKNLTSFLLIFSNTLTVLILWAFIPILHDAADVIHYGVFDVQLFMIVLTFCGIGLSLAFDSERRLITNELLFQAAIDKAPMPAMIHEEQGTILKINDSWRTLTGYFTEDIPTIKDWTQKAYGTDWKMVQDDIQKLYSLPEPKNEGEYQVRCKNGRFRTWEFKSMSLGQLPNGRRMAISMATDVTERKKAEDLLRLFYDVPFMGMGIIDPKKRRWTMVNDCLCEILGQTRESLLQMGWDNFIQDAFQKKQAELARLFAGDIDDLHIENKISRNGNATVDINLQMHCVKDAKSSVPLNIVATMHDITLQKKFEEQFIQSEKMRAIGTLAGGVAHDFNNQLASILGYTEIVKLRTRDKTQDKYLDNIIRSVDRASSLTQQLLSFGRRGKILDKPVLIDKIISDVASIAQHSFDKRIKVQVEILSPNLYTPGDAAQLENAFLNLAINARDSMPDGGELKITASWELLDQSFCSKVTWPIQPGKYVSISVADSGCGMDDTTLAQIFEPFFTTKPEGSGSGMGLASVYGTIDSHKGCIVVDSSLNQGTTFNIFLPACDESLDSQAQQIQQPVTGKANILIVDDEEDVRHVAKEMLTSLGYRVTDIGNSRDALHYYRNNWQELDLVILDMTMPEMDGRETFNAMKKIHPGIRAILASGYSLEGKAQNALNDGVIAYIGKPFRLADLSKYVHNALQQVSG